MRNEIALPALLAAGLALTATTATADDFAEGLYAGIGVGSTSVKQGGFDDSDTSFKIFAGYAFNKFFAVELSYLDGGTARQTDNVSFPDLPAFDFSFRTEIENKITNLSLVSNLPLTESFSLFGRLGYAYIDTDTQASSFFTPGGGLTSSDSNRTERLSYGAGATYSFGKSFQLRAEYEGFDVSHGNLSALTLSGIFRF